MGFERIYVPEASLKNEGVRGQGANKSIKIIPVRTLSNLEKLGLW